MSGGGNAALPRFKKKLTVLSLKELHRGQGRGGNPYVMYEVEALDEQGKRCDQAAGGVPLRTFDDSLPLNELVEYEVAPKDTERHGRTYTLFIPRAPTWQRLDALEAKVAALEAKLAEALAGQNFQPPSEDSASDVVPAAAAGAEPKGGTQAW